jgi:hypothetical protein
MRRLARHLFTLCAAVSLVLCVAVCVLWVRSYQRADLAGRVDGSALFALGSYRGHLLCFYIGRGRGGPSDVEYGHDFYSMSDSATAWDYSQSSHGRSTASGDIPMRSNELRACRPSRHRDGVPAQALASLVSRGLVPAVA